MAANGHQTPSPTIVLASSSRYRAQLLSRYFPRFSTVSAPIDESAHGGEVPQSLALRLAAAKAEHVANQQPDSIIIGCDQVAALQDGGTSRLLGKPGGRDQAFEQLIQMSGKTVYFYTACCVMDTRDNSRTTFCDPYQIVIRPLSPALIDAYLAREQPYDCSASIKSEGLGGALIAAHHGTDPATLIGLPLIKLLDALASLGLHPL